MGARGKLRNSCSALLIFFLNSLASPLSRKTQVFGGPPQTSCPVLSHPLGAALGTRDAVVSLSFQGWGVIATGSNKQGQDDRAHHWLELLPAKGPGLASSQWPGQLPLGQPIIYKLGALRPGFCGADRGSSGRSCQSRQMEILHEK